MERLRALGLLMATVAAAGLAGCPFDHNDDEDQTTAAAPPPGPAPSPPPPSPPPPPPPPSPAPSATQSLASIFFVTYARLADGSLRSCGHESHGELGDGGTTTDGRTSPGALAGLTGGVTSVSGGGYTGVAVRSDGSTWSWGNAAGDATTPTMTAGVTTAVAACIASDSATVAEGLALLADGSVHTGLGAGAAVPGIAHATAIACGAAHYLALLADGTVMAWGANGPGQLGNGTFGGTVATPAGVIGLSGVTAIAAGGDHSMALRSDGTVWTWGDNSVGQLGVATPDSRNLAAAVPSFAGVVSIAAGGNNSMALRSDGTAYIWGANDGGQLGNGLPAGSPASSATPFQVPGLNGVTDIAVGQFSTAFAVLGDGSVKAWGYDAFGELCFPASGGPAVTTPQTVPGLNVN